MYLVSPSLLVHLSRCRSPGAGPCTSGPVRTSRRAADLLCETFGLGKKSLVRASSHVGMASTSVLEPMAVLYRLTGERRYLDFCHSILEVWEQPPASRILTSLLEHGDVHKTANNKAHEMLSNLERSTVPVELRI